MGKVLPIEKIINFKIENDYISSNDKKYVFYRFFPPNMSIMTDKGLDDEFESFSRVLDILQRPLTIFTTDKIEDYSDVKAFYSSLSPRYEFMTSEILNKLDSVEVESTSVQRSFYFIDKPIREGDDDVLATFVGKGYRVARVLKPELAILMRNYMVREFISTDIYTIEQDIDQNPKYKKKRQELRDYEILRAICPRRMDFNIFYAEQNDYLRQTIMIKNFPSQIPPTALLKVATITGTSFTIRLTPMNRGTARKMTDQQIKNKRMMGGQNDVTKQMDSDQEEQDIRNFYAEIARNQNSVYHVNVYIEMYGKSQDGLNKVFEEVTNELTANSITYETLRYEQIEAFKSVNPLGQDNFLSSANNMPSTTVAALYPASHSSKVDSKGMILGRTVDGGNMIIDLWKRSADITASNFGVTGKTGEGKSRLIKRITSMQLASGTHCFSLDAEDEYVDLYNKIGDAKVIDCADGKMKINPFEVRALKTRAEDEADTQDLNTQQLVEDELSQITTSTPMFMQHLSWLEDYFIILFPDMPSRTHRCLMLFVQDMYERFSMNSKSNYSSFSSTDYPTFSSLYDFTMAQKNSYTDLMNENDVKDVLLYLRNAAYGSLSPLINGHTTISSADSVNFSLGNLLQGSKARTQAILFNITTYIWNIISRKENRVMLTCDELYLFLENEMMAKYFNSFVKRSRKYNAALGVGTQQMADCLRGKNADYTTAIFANSPYKFMFFPGETDLDLTRDALKLNDGEMRCISSSNQRHCLVKAGNNCYHMKVGTYDYETDLFGKAGGV